MSVKRLVPLHAVVLDSDPTATRMGEIYFNSVDSELRFYDGTEWLPIGSGGMVSGLLDHIHTYECMPRRHKTVALGLKLQKCTQLSNALLTIK